MKNIIKARRGGFTLVELLIVIIIIAILAGMMMMTSASATAGADATKIISDLRTAKAATLMYFADYNEWPVTTDNDTMVTSLSKYLDRSIDLRYSLTAYAEGQRTFIGFTVAGLSAAVEKKLADSAHDSGLYGEGAAVYTSGTVYVPMMK